VGAVSGDGFPPALDALVDQLAAAVRDVLDAHGMVAAEEPARTALRVAALGLCGWSHDARLRPEELAVTVCVARALARAAGV